MALISKKTQRKAYKQKVYVLNEEKLLTKTNCYAYGAVTFANTVVTNWQGIYMIASETNTDNFPFID